MIAIPVKIYCENELVRFLKNKDQEVFNYLYTNYAPCLYVVINKIVNDIHTSEDVLQEVFIKIWSKIDQHNPLRGTLFTWMVNIARNAAKDVLRTKGEIMKHKINAEDTPLHVGKTSPQTDTIGIRSLISKLRPEYQRVVEMVYYKGYTVVDAAKALQIPEGTVKSRIREAIRLLRKDFQYVVG